MSDPQIAALLDDLLRHIRLTLGDRLLGLYLYGSQVTGDFDPLISDLDLLAVLRQRADRWAVAVLGSMHRAFVERYPAWADRIEVQYVAAHDLQTFKSHPIGMAVISPGEPLHLIAAGANWTVNWYMVQERGRTLFGPPPDRWIEPIEHAEFVATIGRHMRQWRRWIVELPRRPGALAYAILTMCRGLYTVTCGQQVPKRQAARWAQRELPEWAALIERALVWRCAQPPDPPDLDAVYIQTVRFVRAVIDRIDGEIPA